MISLDGNFTLCITCSLKSVYSDVTVPNLGIYPRETTGKHTNLYIKECLPSVVSSFSLI